MRYVRPLVLGLAVSIVPAGCSKDEEQPPQPTAEELAAKRAREDSIARVRAATEEVRTMVARRVRFAFDRSAIRRGQDTQVLEEKLAILQANPGLRLQITGHCDARGSNAYNMRLGQRRADAAKKFLTDRGIAADRITTTSRGEEEPIAQGGNEQAWSQNRRVEFAITGGGDALQRPTP